MILHNKQFLLMTTSSNLDSIFKEQLIAQSYSFKSLTELIKYLDTHNYKEALATYEWLNQVDTAKDNHDIYNLCLAAKEQGAITLPVFEKIKHKLTMEGVFRGAIPASPGMGEAVILGNPMDSIFRELLSDKEFDDYSIKKIIEYLKSKHFDKTIATYEWLQQISPRMPAVLNLCVAAKNNYAISDDLYKQIKKNLKQKGIRAPQEGGEVKELSRTLVELIKNQSYSKAVLSELVTKLTESGHEKVVTSYENYKQVTPQYPDIVNLCIAARDNGIITGDTFQKLKKKLVAEGVCNHHSVQ